MARWRRAPTADPAFVRHPEDVLGVSHRPDAPARPVVGPDEPRRRLLADTRPPRPATPERPARHDPADARGGVANLFLVPEPRRGRRAVTVSVRRTRLDVAACVAALVDVPDPHAERIVPVLDRRNTHAPATRDAACPPAGATRLADELELHHTPKHGSWRTMAEVELSARRRRGLRRRLPDRGAMAREVGAWATRRNDQTKRIDRQVTTADARTTLERLYPAFEA